MALRDAVYGLAVGDSLGVPYEFLSRGSFECEDMVGFGTHNQPAGTWSDDTSMTLATCDSIRELGRVDTGDMRAKFRRWLFDGAYTVDDVFDFGATTYRALESGQGCSGEWDNGNGSLMRIAPLAYTDASDEEIRAVSAITHAHDISCNACVEFVHFLRAPSKQAVGSEPPSSSGFVLHTLAAAQWCFSTTDSFTECVLAAVNLGSDSDTTAAVAGAIAGEYYGYEAIPKEWLQALRGKEIIEVCLF